jgi:hypothetical protein
MSIFPSENVTLSSLIHSTVRTSAALPLAKEYAWDFEKNDFLIIYSGKNVIVTGKEAVKVWIWKVLHTKKKRYQAYTDKYGNELESLINCGLSNEALRSELARYLKESLMVNAYVTGVKDIVISLDGSLATISFTATTVYGEVVITNV